MILFNKNMALALLATLSAIPAMASNQINFSCKTDKVIEDEKPTKIKFSVTNLGKKNVEYVDANEDGTPVIMIPNNSVLMLNDNYGIKMQDGNLVMDSDGDGCQFTTFVLYKDAEFKKGYVRVKDGGCGATPVYSTVTCTNY